MSGPMYKFDFVEHASVAKLVRRKLLTQRSWVRFPVNINIFVKKMSSFFPRSPIKILSGFRKGAALRPFWPFLYYFLHFEVVLGHLFGKIITQVESPK